MSNLMRMTSLRNVLVKYRCMFDFFWLMLDNIHIMIFSWQQHLDTHLQSMIKELEEIYHDKCEVHKPLICFHHRPLDLHFILNDDWKKIWANGIVSVVSEYIWCILIFESWCRFLVLPQRHCHQCLWIPSHPSIPAIPYMMPFPMYHPSMVMPSPYFAGLFPPSHPIPDIALHVQDRSSSPQITGSSPPPPPPEASVHEMCELFKLGDNFIDRLELLKFQIGDDLSVLPEEKRRSAGFEDLEWNHLLKAYCRYKKMLHNWLWLSFIFHHFILHFTTLTFSTWQCSHCYELLMNYNNSIFLAMTEWGLLQITRMSKPLPGFVCSDSSKCFQQNHFWIITVQYLPPVPSDPMFNCRNKYMISLHNINGSLPELKQSSIGLKSGEYCGRNWTAQPSKKLVNIHL